MEGRKRRAGFRGNDDLQRNILSNAPRASGNYRQQNTPLRMKMQAIDQQLVISEKLANFVMRGMSNNMKTAEFSELQAH